MATYTIENNEILIRFDRKPSDDVCAEMKALRIWWDPDRSIWHGEYSPEREALAQRLCPPAAPLQVINPLPASASLDERLNRILQTKDEGERCALENGVKLSIEEEIDAYVRAIRGYKQEEEAAAEEKKAQEETIKAAVEDAVARKKAAAEKRRFLETIIKEHLIDTGEGTLIGNKFRVRFEEKGSSYSISDELMANLLSQVRAILPEWITVELKPDAKTIRQMDEVPAGVEEHTSFKLQTWTDAEGDPSIPSYILSLNAFNEGLQIKQISENRNLKWSTIKSHLMKAIEEGCLDIHQHVPDSVLNELESLRGYGDQWKISDFRSAIHNQISYDWTSLALSYLRIWSAD